jgi:hypothetical protein
MMMRHYECHVHEVQIMVKVTLTTILHQDCRGASAATVPATMADVTLA